MTPFPESTIEETALDASGAKTAELRYKAWGEIRYAWSAAAGLPTQFTYTGQRSYQDDPTTTATEGFGLMYYNARWYDVYLNHFTQPDTIIPSEIQGTQAWDRYAYSNNNPVRYTDPSGHCISDPASFMVCAMVAGAVIGGVANAFHQYNEAGSVDLGQAATAATKGALIGGGAVIATVAAAAVAPMAIALFTAANADGDPTNEINATSQAIEGATPSLKNDWAKLSGQLKEAVSGKGNFGIGEATTEHANAMGDAWVGENPTVLESGIKISKDGLRQFRPPTYKPFLNMFQANFEYRLERMKRWFGNAHLNIVEEE